MTTAQSRDTGMAMVLLCLLIGNVFWSVPVLNFVAIGALVMTMTVPRWFKPLAVVWFGLSKALGAVVSKVLLSIIYFGLVTPLGLVVNLIQNDTMALKKFKKSTTSAFKTREKAFVKADLDHPF